MRPRPSAAIAHIQGLAIQAERHIGRASARRAGAPIGGDQAQAATGGAVIFKGGTDVRGIKTAAAIWITGAIGLAVGTSLWWLGAIVSVTTAAVLFLTDLFPSTRQQIEQNAEQVEQRVEHAEQDAEQAKQRAAQADGRAATRTKETG